MSFVKLVQLMILWFKLPLNGQMVVERLPVKSVIKSLMVALNAKRLEKHK